LVVLLLLILRTTLADPPTLEHVFPVGVARGATNTITVAGKFEPWPPKVWASKYVDSYFQ
jgi:hypothetical protein